MCSMVFWFFHDCAYGTSCSPKNKKALQCVEECCSLLLLLLCIGRWTSPYTWLKLQQPFIHSCVMCLFSVIFVLVNCNLSIVLQFQSCLSRFKAKDITCSWELKMLCYMLFSLLQKGSAWVLRRCCIWKPMYWCVLFKQNGVSILVYPHESC